MQCCQLCSKKSKISHFAFFYAKNVNLPPPIDETFYSLAAASKSISAVPKAETRPTKFHDWVWFRPEAGPSSKKATGLYYIDAQSRHIPVGNKL